MDKGDICLVEIPTSYGHEQGGLRSVIVFSNEIAGTISVIPFTTKKKSLDYNYVLEIENSNENGLNDISFALVFQLRVIDRKKIKNKIGELENGYIIKINEMLKDMLRLGDK